MASERVKAAAIFEANPADVSGWLVVRGIDRRDADIAARIATDPSLAWKDGRPAHLPEGGARRERSHRELCADSGPYVVRELIAALIAESAGDSLADPETVAAEVAWAGVATDRAKRIRVLETEIATLRAHEERLRAVVRGARDAHDYIGEHIVEATGDVLARLEDLDHILCDAFDALDPGDRTALDREEASEPSGDPLAAAVARLRTAVSGARREVARAQSYVAGVPEYDAQTRAIERHCLAALAVLDEALAADAGEEGR